MTAQHPLRGDVAVLVPAAGLGTRLGPGRAEGAAGAGRGVAAGARRAPARPARRRGLCRGRRPGRRGRPRSAPRWRPTCRPASSCAWSRAAQTRQASVAAALAAVPAGYPIILVHDAARAFAPPELVERVAAAVRAGHDAVIPGAAGGRHDQAGRRGGLRDRHRGPVDAAGRADAAGLPPRGAGGRARQRGPYRRRPATCTDDAGLAEADRGRGCSASRARRPL